MRAAADWLVAAIILGASGIPAPAIQVLPGEAERDHLRDELRAYHAMAADYRRGGGVAVERLVSWDKGRIQRVLAAIDTVRDDGRPWAEERLRAAAMMHTDVAVGLAERSETEAALLHIDAGSQLLKLAGPGARTYAGRWHQAMAWLLRHHNRLLEAEQFLETARRRQPGHPAVLYESGILQELLASDTVVPTVVYLPDLRAPDPSERGSSAESQPPLTRAEIDDLKRRRTNRLNRAAEWLRDSLERDPSHILARLHLGRVETLRGRYDTALTLLEGAEASGDSDVAYLAALFAGAVHEREGRLDAAAVAYRAAIGRFPSSHAAYIALSAVLHRSGRAADSGNVLRQALDGATASRREPWWSYLAEPLRTNLARLDMLRKEARR
jgi:tetratricopeptide (TPR) repeat protein